MYVNIFRLTCVKLRIRLENFKGVFARVSRTSDRLYFASVEIDKIYSLTLPPWKNLCHRWSRGQPRPLSFFQRLGETEKREPGNVGVFSSPLARVRRLAGFRTKSCSYENENVLYAWSWNIRKEFQ